MKGLLDRQAIERMGQPVAPRRTQRNGPPRSLRRLTPCHRHPQKPGPRDPRHRQKPGPRDPCHRQTLASSPWRREARRTRGIRAGLISDGHNSEKLSGKDKQQTSGDVRARGSPNERMVGQSYPNKMMFG